MAVDYKKIRDRIQKFWPNCRNVWLSDLEYQYPSRGDVEMIVGLDHTERLTMRGYKFDCDDFALQLAAAVSRYVGENWEGQPWPFGIVKGRRFQHLTEPHQCNICVLEKEIFIIEPQTDEIREASGIDDSIFFVGMPS